MIRFRDNWKAAAKWRWLADELNKIGRLLNNLRGHGIDILPNASGGLDFTARSSGGISGLSDDLPLDVDVHRISSGHNGASAGVSSYAARKDHRHDSNMPDGTIGDVLYYKLVPTEYGVAAWQAVSLADLIGAALDNLGIESLPEGTQSEPHLKWDHVGDEWKKALIVPDGSAEGDMMYWHEYSPLLFRWERLAAAPASGKYTLVSNNGVLGWVEVADGVCE